MNQPNENKLEAAYGNKKAMGITFSETMAGSFCLGETEPTLGAGNGKTKGALLSMHATIQIDDIDKFIADPSHSGTLTGTIDYPPFGNNMVITSGQFNLFSPSDDPKLKYMLYQCAFSHDGNSYYLVGQKEVKDDKGFDLWSDTTTLFTRLYEVDNNQGKQLGAGILSLGLSELVAMVTTFKVINSNSVLTSANALRKFAQLFIVELWKSYGPKL